MVAKWMSKLTRRFFIIRAILPQNSQIEDIRYQFFYSTGYLNAEFYADSNRKSYLKKLFKKKIRKVFPIYFAANEHVWLITFWWTFSMYSKSASNSGFFFVDMLIFAKSHFWDLFPTFWELFRLNVPTMVQKIWTPLINVL